MVISGGPSWPVVGSVVDIPRRRLAEEKAPCGAPNHSQRRLSFHKAPSRHRSHAATRTVTPATAPTAGLAGAHGNRVPIAFDGDGDVRRVDPGQPSDVVGGRDPFGVAGDLGPQGANLYRSAAARAALAVWT